MTRLLRTRPLYLLLLPLFFVLHGYLENFGFISIKDSAVLVLSYSVLTSLIFIFSFFVFRELHRAALITAMWMAFFFFFAALHEFLRQHSPILLFSRYGFLLCTFTGLFVILFVFLKRTKKPLKGIRFFLNVLMCVYILVDLAGVAWKAFHPGEHQLSVYGFTHKFDYRTCDTCKKSDIYFLLFDEYASTLSLQQQYNFHNNIDSFLTGKGFHVQPLSHSCYNFTAFSMSSILNMSYIDGIENVKAVTSDDYANCNRLIRENEVIKFLDLQGYEIVNYSVFDLAGNPAMVQQSFLPLKTKLITDRTLFARMNKDIGWVLITKFPFNLFNKNDFLKHLDNNNRFLDLVKKASSVKKPRPRFIYAHFYMPHPPFFFDRNGQRKDNKTVYDEYKFNPPPAYRDYVVYVNSQIRSLVDTIQKNDPSASIVLMGDHGYRTSTTDPHPLYHFQNMNAIYYPDKDYKLLYDSISGVNQFRVVLNKLFHQSFPLLADSSIFLKDKK